MEYVTFVSESHWGLGYLIFALVVVELLWSTVEVLTDSEPGTVSSVKSSAVVGLVDLQTLLGFVNAYLLSTVPGPHMAAMLGAVGALHVAKKQSQWVRVGLQALGAFLVVLGIGFRHMA